MRKIIFCILFIFVSVTLAAQSINNNKVKPLTQDMLISLCDNELSLMRNEIYARHGYVFSKEEIQEYFSSQDWYKPVSDNKLVVLSKVEQDNVALIKRIEAQRQGKYNAVKSYFLETKAAFSRNDVTYINKLFSGVKGEYEQDMIDALGEALSKIDPKDINYYRDKGLFKVIVDNGFVIRVYSLTVDKNEIVVMNSYQAHSEIIDGFDECTTYMSENEYAYWWIFRIKEDNTIMLDSLDIAG